MLILRFHAADISRADDDACCRYYAVDTFFFALCRRHRCYIAVFRLRPLPLLQLIFAPAPIVRHVTYAIIRHDTPCRRFRHDAA